MKMKTIFPRRLGALFTGSLWIAVLAFAAPAQAPPPSRPGNATCPRTQVQAVTGAFPSGATHASGSRLMAELERQMWALVNRDRRDPANAKETRGRAQPLQD